MARQGSGTRVAPLPSVGSEAPQAHARTRAPRFDLRPGSPDVGAFPAAAWLRALRRAIATAPSLAYDYGDPRGRIELRTALSGYLGRARGVLAPPERIVITSGYVQGLALLTRVLEGAPLAMEDPGLPFHREVVRRNGGTVLPVRVDERGVRAGELGEAAAVVVTPAHQYPTGVTLHPERRRALTDWARAGGGLIVEDDYDGEFRYDRQPVGALQGLDPDRVVYLGTASKSLAPGLRLGWMALPPSLVEEAAAAKGQIDTCGVLDQLTLAEFLASGAYDRHVRSARLRYRRRRDALAAAVADLAPDVRVTGIAAGLHAVLRLPPGTEQSVIQAATWQGLALHGLAFHRHEQAIAEPLDALVVGYGTPPDSAWAGALAALCRVLP